MTRSKLQNKGGANNKNTQLTQYIFKTLTNGFNIYLNVFLYCNIQLSTCSVHTCLQSGQQLCTGCHNKCGRFNRRLFERFSISLKWCTRTFPHLWHLFSTLMVKIFKHRWHYRKSFDIFRKKFGVARRFMPLSLGQESQYLSVLLHCC